MYRQTPSLTQLLRLTAAGVLATVAGIFPIETLVASPFPPAQQQRYSTIALAQKSDEQTRIQVYQKASPAVVIIKTDKGSGSGFIVSRDGLVLTNAHVVKDASPTVTVTLADGREFSAEVIDFKQEDLDIAALKISNQNNLPTIRLAKSDSVKVGQSVYAIGTPFGEYQNTFTAGVVSRIDRQRGLIQHDAPTNPGNSGSPLLNSQAEVIGIDTSGYRARVEKDGEVIGEAVGNIGVNFAISVELVRPFLKEVKQFIKENSARVVREEKPRSNLVASGDGKEGEESHENTFLDDATCVNRGKKVDRTVQQVMVGKQLYTSIMQMSPGVKITCRLRKTSSPPKFKTLSLLFGLDDDSKFTGARIIVYKDGEKATSNISSHGEVNKLVVNVKDARSITLEIDCPPDIPECNPPEELDESEKVKYTVHFFQATLDTISVSERD